MFDLLKLLTILLVMVFAVFCKTPHQSDKTKKRRAVVMLIDNEFDADIKILKNNVIAQVDLICPTQSTHSIPRGAAYKKMTEADYVDLAKSIISRSLKRCIVKDKVVNHDKLIRNKLKLTDKLTDEWNSAVKKRDFSSLTNEEVMKVYHYQNHKFSHGTASASIISYKNQDPVVAFVFVHISEPDQGNLDESECAKPEYKYHFKNLAKALVNKDVIAWSASQEDTWSKSVMDVAEKYKVDFINFSSGYQTYDNTKEYYQQKNCKEFGDYITSLQKISALQRSKSKIFDNSQPYLFFQSAGNTSYKINTPSDIGRCTAKDDNHLVIGSYDAFNRISSFSNYGKCVDYYNLGSQVIAVLPGNVLFPQDGTSFATPLVIRYLTKSLTSLSPKAVKLKLQKMADERKFLKGDPHLSEISFEAGAGSSFQLSEGNHLNFDKLYEASMEEQQQKYFRDTSKNAWDLFNSGMEKYQNF